MTNDLATLYPQYANKRSLRLQRYTIVPIGVPSEHNDKQIIFTEPAANKMINQLIDSPLMYAPESEDDESELPIDHGKPGDLKRVIGKAIGGGIMTDEQGVRWVYADFIIYYDANKDIYDKLVEKESEVGCSMEAYPMMDDEGMVHDMEEYVGTSIVMVGKQAWETELLVASKGAETPAAPVTPPSVTVTYDDVIKTIVGNDYNAKLNALTEELNRANKIAADLTDRLAVQQTINQKLLENQNLIKNLS